MATFLSADRDCDFGEDIWYSEGESDTTRCWSMCQIQLVLGMLLPFWCKMKWWGTVSRQSVRVSNTRYVTNEKCRSNIGEDRISGLPDDIILTFLSSMEMKEAAKTSIFSKRWRCLWAKRTHLDFDYFLAFPESHPDMPMRSLTITQKNKYINGVNQVLGLHGNECIDTLRVCFLSDDSSDAHHFDKWVKFALSRKVKNLELYSLRGEVVYTLGFDILNPSVGIGDSRVSSLTSLHLYRVDVTGDFIEFLLSKCHNLERLYVGFSSLLVRLKVIGLSYKLKQLAICYCDELEELEIDAVNLLYLECRGQPRRTNLVFKSMPFLVEAAFGRTWSRSPLSIFQQFLHLAAHIHKLSLDMKFSRFPDGALPTFCNLKLLNMVVDSIVDVPAKLTPLLEACPVLQELKLEICWFLRDVGSMPCWLDIMLGPTANDFEVLDCIELRQIEGKTHPNLKLLQIVAYIGYWIDVEIILYIVRYACNLETIICDPEWRNQRFDDYSIERSRARAYKLRKIIPPKISVMIL